MVGWFTSMIYTFNTTTKNCEFIAFCVFLSFVLSETERDEVDYKLLPGGPSNENENKDPKKEEVSVVIYLL